MLAQYRALVDQTSRPKSIGQNSDIKLTMEHQIDISDKIMSVSSDMSKNIRVGRPEKIFFFYFFIFFIRSLDQTFFPTKFASFTSK